MTDANSTAYSSDGWCSAGAVIERIQLPERFTPSDIGDDWTLGREFDDLDVEHVTPYPLVSDIR